MKRLLSNVKSALLALWAIPLVSRAVHTFWQAFLAVFALGATGVLSVALQTHSVPATEDATIALLVAAIAAGLSALKTFAVAYVESLKAQKA